MRLMLQISEWFSYSHWGMFKLPILIAPDWHAYAVVGEQDDDLLEESPK